ncbi:MAG: hypothetical protein BMS9Abin07_1350 [Acidimicrobiia bacterium]|nr:MAG: hypothetical protein BMS9Abin07_1350 [Acidimicrobiia bacterium]
MTANAENSTYVISGSCSLDHDTRAGRFASLAELWSVALVSRERVDGGVVLAYRDDTDLETAIREFAATEQQCCPGFDIAVEHDGDRLLWTVTLNEPADPGMLDALWDLTAKFVDVPAAPVSAALAASPATAAVFCGGSDSCDC